MAEAEHCTSSSSQSSDNKSERANSQLTVYDAEDSVVPGTATGTTGLDALLERKKSEVMYELRHLKMGERPVTGTDSRKQLDNFFTRRVEAAAKAEQDMPANMDAVEQHRPEAIVVEVQGLFEHQPVTTILQSTAFRRNLEQVVLRGLSGLRRNVSESPRLSIPRVASSSSLISTVSSNASTESNNSHHSDHLNDSNSVTGRTTTSERRGVISGPPSTAVVQPPSPPPVPTLSGNISMPTPPHPWLMQHVQQGHNPPSGWNMVEEAARETLVSEISDLVQRQLVTSTLDGNFRAILELQMQDRLVQAGVNGSSVQEFIHQIPQSQFIARNDFSHLGIQAPGQHENLDNISVVSATAIPYAQSNLAMSREMQAIKAQLAELKNMMQLSFTMQMDMQRSIRQEVAAAMNQTNAPEQPPTQYHMRPVSDTNCIICLDSHADSVLYQCGHVCICYTCGVNLRSRGANCPVCRAPIRDVIRAYQCNARSDGS